MTNDYKQQQGPHTLNYMLITLVKQSDCAAKKKKFNLDEEAKLGRLGVGIMSFKV